MIGVSRTVKQKAGRFRKNILKKIKNLIWQNKNKNFEDLDENWDD
jgi:hypothetical protein